MPQGGRKTPFSGKAKKQQLQAKKNRTNNAGKVVSHIVGSDDESEGGIKSQKLNAQPSKGKGRNTNKYALQFHQETKEENDRRKELARRALNPVPEAALEVDAETPYPPDLGFPKRPKWDSTMSREVLEAREQKYFREFVGDLDKRFSLSELSYFEMNLETWRQLWRVLEMSDVVLFIVDIRFPVHLFPPSLYSYVTKVLHKDMILVLNKVDLAPAPLVLAWKHFFKGRYPSLQVLMFTSCPGYNLRQSNSKPGGLQVRRRKGRQKMAAEGAQQLLQACENTVGDKVDLSSWHKKIADELDSEYEDEGLEIDETIEVKSVDTGYVNHERYIGGVLTIGCVGQPNVGKSSLMNAIMGKKVLMGSYPIAQLREPFSSVQFLAERLNLVALLRLQHPEGDDEWSAFDVCDAWAKLRGFLTAKAARLDSYRSANHLLRMALDGKICLCLYPPDFVKNRGLWEGHPELAEVLRVQAKSRGEEASAMENIDLSSEEEEEEEEKMVGATTSHPQQASRSSDSEEGEPSLATNKFALLDDQD